MIGQRCHARAGKAVKSNSNAAAQVDLRLNLLGAVFLIKVLVALISVQKKCDLRSRDCWLAMGDYASNDSSCEEAGLCSYELKRLENIRKNQEILKSLGEFSSHNMYT